MRICATSFSSGFQKPSSLFVSAPTREPPSQHNACTKRRLQYLSIWRHCFGIDFSTSTSLGNVFIHLGQLNISRSNAEESKRNSKRGRQSKNKLDTLNKHENAPELRLRNRMATAATTTMTTQRNPLKHNSFNSQFESNKTIDGHLVEWPIELPAKAYHRTGSCEPNSGVYGSDKRQHMC